MSGKWLWWPTSNCVRKFAFEIMQMCNILHLLRAKTKHKTLMLLAHFLVYCFDCSVNHWHWSVIWGHIASIILFKSCVHWKLYLVATMHKNALQYSTRYFWKHFNRCLLFVLNVDVDRSFSILAQKDTDQRAKVAQSIIKFNCLTGVKWFRGDREQRCLCL